MPVQVDFVKPKRANKKYKVVLYEEGEKVGDVEFGQKDASDFLIHKDKERRRRYIDRHSNEREKGLWRFSKKNLFTPAFWSRWLSWNQPSLKESMDFIEDRMNVEFINRQRAYQMLHKKR